jgi:predicted small secreted protein
MGEKFDPDQADPCSGAAAQGPMFLANPAIWEGTRVGSRNDAAPSPTQNWEPDMNRIRLIAAPILAALLLAGCQASVGIGERIVDAEDAETQIADELEEQVGQRPKSIECPDDMKAEEGETYTCVLTAEDGTELDVALTMTDDEGNFEIEVLGN